MKRFALWLAAVCTAGLCSARIAPDSVSAVLAGPLHTCRVVHAEFHDQSLIVRLHPSIQQEPVREETLKEIEAELRSRIGAEYDTVPIALYTMGQPLESFIPNAYRTGLAPDPDHTCPTPSRQAVTPLDGGSYPLGLSGRTIAAWPSHGWYFEPRLNRWEWQRARCFSTVEDISSTGYVNAYLAPMLERAGARVLLPRERDVQPEQIVLDNDARKQQGHVRRIGRWRSEGEGFAYRPVIRGSVNPFREGTWLGTEAGRRSDRSRVEYIPRMEQAGDYAVYVSWGAPGPKAGKALCEVRHTGGVTRFELDERVDGRTWHYLGTFRFDRGEEAARGSVMIRPAQDSPDGSTVTADAVRFGGGYGTVARGQGANESTSDALAYMEGARYYLQAAGMPDSVYTPTAGENDYNDDYRCRSLWVNHLVHEMGQPVDLSFAFHTDAGCTPDSSIVGTLSIYSTYDGDNEYMGHFSDGRPKIVNRDLADMVQTSIVEDVRALFNRDWTRRDLRDASYNEAWRPDVPSMLLELLSHQNLADLRYSLDPRFRFAVARAIYKAMARFVAGNEGRPCVIAPLPPVRPALRAMGGRRIRIEWQPVTDPLEPTAEPTAYRLYTRTDDGGWDNGTLLTGTRVERELPEWNRRYAFRISAVNGGGESFPTEELSACLVEGATPVLVVNGFTRVAAPLTFDEGDMAGLAWWEDEGVPDGFDTHFVGREYDFRRSSPWLDDDCPGWGASGSEGFNRIIGGNRNDFASAHGRALSDRGYAYLSTSRADFERPDFDPTPYAAVDLVMGEQRTTHSFNGKAPQFTVWTPAMRASVERTLDAGRPVLMSGAHIGSDMTFERDTAAMLFAAKRLGFVQRNHIASQTGELLPVDSDGFLLFPPCRFTTELGGAPYRVEAPDALEPARPEARHIYRYRDTRMSAGIALDTPTRVIALGFPLEAVADEGERAAVMDAAMRYLLRKPQPTNER